MVPALLRVTLISILHEGEYYDCRPAEHGEDLSYG